MNKIFLAGIVLSVALVSGCDNDETAKSAVRDNDETAKSAVRDLAVQEMKRLLAKEEPQIIAGCRYVTVDRDGDFIIVLASDNSGEDVLGLLRVSASGEVLLNSLPANLTFDQLMELTRKAQFVRVSEWNQVCPKNLSAIPKLPKRPGVAIVVGGVHG